jgi:hypothetical protein
MAGVLLSWAFNNPLYSDMKIALTTASPDALRQHLLDAERGAALPAQKRACLAGAVPDGQRTETASTSRPSPDTECSAAAAQHTNEASEFDYELMYGHKLVLSSNSEFFKVTVNWEGSSSAGPPAGSTAKPPPAAIEAVGNKRQQTCADQPQYVVVSVADATWLGPGREMLQFLYTQKLKADASLLELMQLLQLADEYNVPTLRCAALSQLRSLWSLNKKWKSPEVEHLSRVLAIVGNDAEHAEGELKTAANQLLDDAAAGFTLLEQQWRYKEMRELFSSCLPKSMVLKVVRAPRLAVESEGTVLVAVLSWLAASGQGMTVDERWQVLQHVRLLQLPPWVFSWLLQYSLECQPVIPTHMVAQLVRYRLMDACHREQLMQKSSVLRMWAPARGRGTSSERADDGAQLTLKGGMEEQAVYDAVAACCQGKGKTSTKRVGTLVYRGGLAWRAQIRVVKGAPGHAKVQVAAVAAVRVAGRARLEQLEGYPCNYSIRVGDRLKKHLVETPAGPVWYTLACIKPGDDPKAVLAGYIKEGMLTVQVKLHSTAQY